MPTAEPTAERAAEPLPRCPDPGVTVRAGGLDVAVHAAAATAVWLCVLDGDGRETRHRLPGRRHGWWFGHLPGLGPGTRYALRADGPWAPEQGHRHNPAKLLLDPYARAVHGPLRLGPEVYGHVVDADGRGEDTVRDDRDSAGRVPVGVVVDGAFDWGEDAPPAHDPADVVIYEAHVRELTRLHPDVPEHLRGTYAGVAHPATVAHLRRVGATALELLPIHAFVDEPELTRRGLTDHWGYNTLGYLSPHLPYASTPDDPEAAVAEVKAMVRDLHAAGIEVILDVVYNHTAEQGVTGPTLSWRGLDAACAYRLDERGRDIDVTGCGNTLDLTDVTTQRLVLDSLRHWAGEYHVDGFRFDLAVALARGRQEGFVAHHSFLTALRTDPVLSRVRLIAEPWDVGPHGWRTGQFPAPFAEWDDRFRDAARTFWLADPAAAARGGGPSGHGVRDLATRLAGSQDLFGGPDRGPSAGVAFVTAHDGFTLADLTAYDRKHNEANGEGGRDGSDHDLSWGHGAEGPTDDDGVLAARGRSRRALLGTLLLAAGTPMIASGDEIGRTTEGNNNPYCQDSPLTWLHWDLAPWQDDVLATVAHLTGLRRELGVLRGDRLDERVITWHDEHGDAMGEEQWGQDGRRTVQMRVEDPAKGDAALVVVHGKAQDGPVVLAPGPGEDGGTGWRLRWDSAWEAPDPADGDPDPAGGDPDPREVVVAAGTLRLYSAPSTGA